MMRVCEFVCVCAFSMVATAVAQNVLPPMSFSRADSVRGNYGPLRSCYDVTFYLLDVTVNIDSQSISGSNTIQFTVLEPTTSIQVDLFNNMNVDRIMFEGTELKYRREHNGVFISFPRELQKGLKTEIDFAYSGKPIVAKRPPWEGGFTWTKDTSGNPWVCVTCQGTGASLWWPNKDHQADEPDSMLLRVTVPPGLSDVSNGRLRRVIPHRDGKTTYEWFMSVPINNYDVTVNIGKFSHFEDRYINGDTLTLDYYVIPADLEKARAQFRQVKTMLQCFERYFGKYPFYRDGYKLVESPHLGMEHQTAVAYGNHFLQGYLGRASSEVGLTFDFIIVHESAHEWWGNSVTSKDIADMWLHESFGAYAEALFVECEHGYQESLRYINGKKSNVRNDAPIQGVYNVHRRGSGDMYDKGQLVLNTLRSVIENDTLWFAILRGIQSTFRYKTVDAGDIFGYIEEKAGRNLDYFFDQYWKHATIPQFEAVLIKKGNQTTLRYRWHADVPGFRMPLRVTSSKDHFASIMPTTEWQSLELRELNPDDFRVDEERFYVGVQLRKVYLDPNRSDN